MTVDFKRTPIDQANVAITGGVIDGTPIGTTTATTAKFTTVSLSSDITFTSTSRGLNMEIGDNISIMDFDFPDLITQRGDIRVFRNTNTTGGYRFVFHKGDGSSSSQHQLNDETRDSFLCNLGGNFGVGLTGPAEKLDVSGNILASGTIKASTVIETGSFTVATLPSTSATPNGIIKVSDETGGETLAFSDGTNWRRVQDRAIVA